MCRRGSTALIITSFGGWKQNFYDVYRSEFGTWNKTKKNKIKFHLLYGSSAKIKVALHSISIVMSCTCTWNTFNSSKLQMATN